MVTRLFFIYTQMNLKRSILLLFCIMLYSAGFAETYSLGIGIPKFLSPDPPKGVLYSSHWYCDTEEIGMTYHKDEDSKTYGVTIVINSYFEGTAIIECDYVYEYQYESFGKLYNGVGTGSKSYFIKCSAVPPTSISLPKEKTMHLDETLTLTPTLTPSNAGTTYTWSSSNPTIATVNSSGLVTPKSFGETAITVKTANNLSATCVVTVEKVNATSISIASNKKMIIGDYEEIEYSIYPINSNNSVTWSSSDVTVASVTQQGVVTAKKAGTANIKVETDNGKSDVCAVTVPPLPTQITLPSVVEVNLRKSVQLSAVLIPANALDYLLWNSDNEEIATIDEKGVVTGLRAGQATMTVKSKNAPNVSATCVVAVKEDKYDLIVWTKDGCKVSYRLNKRPTLTYEDGNILLSTTETVVEYKDEDISKYTFENIPDNTSAIQQPKVSSVNASLQQKENTILFEQCEPYSLVQIYSVNGKLVDSFTIGADGTLQIPTEQYPKGLYIIKTKHLTHKILKR